TTALENPAARAGRPSNASCRVAGAPTTARRVSRDGGRARRGGVVGAPRPARRGGVCLPVASGRRAGGAVFRAHGDRLRRAGSLDVCCEPVCPPFPPSPPCPCADRAGAAERRG